MNEYEQKHLEKLLCSLLSAQDSVTYMNAKGRDYAFDCHKAIEKRTAIFSEIVEYVNLLSITSAICPSCGDKLFCAIVG